MFNQTLRARQHHLSNLDMVRGQLVKGRVDDLAADQRAFHIGDFLRPFIDQQYKNYLFNLDKDPAEGYNISMTYPDVADTLLEALKDFRKSLKENRRGIK